MPKLVFNLKPAKTNSFSVWSLKKLKKMKFVSLMKQVSSV